MPMPIPMPCSIHAPSIPSIHPPLMLDMVGGCPGPACGLLTRLLGVDSFHLGTSRCLTRAPFPSIPDPICTGSSLSIAPFCFFPSAVLCSDYAKLASRIQPTFTPASTHPRLEETLSSKPHLTRVRIREYSQSFRHGPGTARNPLVEDAGRKIVERHRSTRPRSQDRLWGFSPDSGLVISPGRPTSKPMIRQIGHHQTHL